MTLVALLDANVLYPAYLRDALLRMAEAGTYQVRWSREILDEMSRNILKNNPSLPRERIERLVRIMEGAFPEAMVSVHESLIDAMTNAPGDRHVLAAAIGGGADVIVTSNVRDFPPSACGPYGVEIQKPDEFMCDLWNAHDAGHLLSAIEDWASHLKTPPLTTEELLEKLAGTVPRFSRLVLEDCLRERHYRDE